MNVTTPTKPAEENRFDEVASLLKTAADPLRMEILRVLAQDSFGVLELASLFDMPQSGMSHHLKVLTKGDWVSTRREGNSIFYRRKPITTGQWGAGLKSALLAELDQQPLTEQRQERLFQVYNERGRTSQQFFAENADKFHAQQDLIASFPVYGEAVCEVLDAIELPSTAHILEVGPGAGELLPWLAQRFDKVTALDNAPEMLHQAQAHNAGLSNVRYLLGDTREAIKLGLSAECVVINMVLHHTPSPAEVFQDLAKLLKSGASLVITDLCRHDQSWARAACGDLWQGFEPEEFNTWADKAGLLEGPSHYFALRNGFQIQIRQFNLALDS